MQTVSKQNSDDLAKKKGVYALLLVGVFVIVAVVMITMTNNGGKTEEKNPIDLNEPPISSVQQPTDQQNSTYAEGDMKNINSAEKNANNERIAGQELVTPEATLTPKPTAEPTEVTKVEEKATEDKEQKTETKPVMQTKAENLVFNKEDGLNWPVKGNIILPYSVERTTYYATLKQYMTNPAILIASEIGTEVKSSAKGIVTDVKDDVRIGNTVTVDIGSGYKVVYGQLDQVSCKTGDIIEVGQVIGKIAKATKYYVIEGSHLYFQVFEGESTIDPMSLLKAE